METPEYAFGCIASYDGHEDWLLNLADDLEGSDGNYPSPFPVALWNKEAHVLWMLLVGLFGNWGTSIRSGWIEDTKGAAEFIRKALDYEYILENPDLCDIEKGANGRWRYRDDG